MNTQKPDTSSSRFLLDCSEIESSIKKMETELLLHELSNSFFMRPETVANCEVYRILHWSGDKLKERIVQLGKVVPCYIVYHGITPFHITWKSEEHMVDCLLADRVAISLRKHTPTKLCFAIPKIIYNAGRPT